MPEISPVHARRQKESSEVFKKKLQEAFKMRVNITLACTETGDRNYITTKNKRNNPDRIELIKYSPRLKKRTLHRETK